jgi:HSP20 family protein
MFALQMIHEMDRAQREMEQFFRSLGVSSAVAPRQERIFKVKDRGEAFEVEAILPGLDVEKLEINVLGRKLTLAGEFVGANAPEGSIWHRHERAQGRFEKSLQLAANIDAEQVEAEYRQGVLTIKLPRAASALPKKIDVKTV